MSTSNKKMGMERAMKRAEKTDKMSRKSERWCIPSIGTPNSGAVVVLLDLGDTFAVEDLGLWQVLQ
jgi:hypothetical protein